MPFRKENINGDFELITLVQMYGKNNAFSQEICHKNKRRLN